MVVQSYRLFSSGYPANTCVLCDYTTALELQQPYSMIMCATSCSIQLIHKDELTDDLVLLQVPRVFLNKHVALC